MKKILIVIASVIALGLFGFAAFTFGSNSSKEAPVEPTSSNASVKNSGEALDATTVTMLALVPGASEALAAVNGACERGMNNRNAEIPLDDSAYEGLATKAKELAGADKSLTIIEDNGDVAVNGMNLNMIYEDGNALLLNIKDGKLTISQIVNC